MRCRQNFSDGKNAALFGVGFGGKKVSKFLRGLFVWQIEGEEGDGEDGSGDGGFG